MTTDPTSPTRPIAVITGANSGVGFHATRHLAEYGWDVVMVCRSEERGIEARTSVTEEYPDASVDLLIHDLASLDDVVALSDRLRELPRLDALVNNAGLYRPSLEHTADGFETTMGVNHVAHMLLTLRLQSHLRRPGTRVVNVSSEGHRHGRLRRAPLDDILRGRRTKFRGVQAYADSKLANVLFTREIVRRWSPDGAVSFALHPGVLSSRIWDNTRGVARGLSFLIRPFMDDPEVGGRATAACVTDDGLAEDDNGAYLKKFDIVEAAPDAHDDELARELWQVTEEAIRPWLPVDGSAPPSEPR
jgi:NAD(P)-dependent dehydrogenase (short-subunit alcohol dehydrogenase family)